MFENKLGIYRVGDLATYSKLEAIELHVKTGIHPQWDFNDAVFSSYNWTKEPNESILELYRQRAQQLRDQYDHVVLFWSGGSDSQTALEAFLDNDIKLDEIVAFGNYEATGDQTDFMNSELFLRILPQAKELQTLYPWMKFRVLDLSQLQIDAFTVANQFDWIYQLNMMLTPNSFARDQIGNKVKDWADIVMQGKKLCLVWGVDKPRVFHNNGRFELKFIDIIDNCVTVNSMAGKNHYTDELFFWSPSLPELVIKQAHLVKNWLDRHEFNSPYVTKKSTGLAYKEHHGEKYWLNNHGMHKIIYPKWNIDTFDAGKPTAGTIFSPRDSWFFNLNQNSTPLHIWQMGIEKISNTIPDYWKNDQNNFHKGIKAMWSKSYFLN